ncbi:cation:dicarboxylate symporter family transporter [Noviherbaspirillum saxi]|uniref:C4-dicarboxylate transporter DctA n=1 Tax=Noviherbaspirillum saxi TaxID=2320863 RepID=A0A3A3FIS3_9BURK|nr:cation:dicarboxylase symporter family transporter [Noviherbaspirillum saxi]RJF92434.1 C4-dicarboxylate transporter DctA [Noviherbaspirillum saxi]
MKRMCSIKIRNSSSTGFLKNIGLRSLAMQMLFAIAAGIMLGYTNPGLAVQMKPLGEWFVSAVRVLVGPIIFFTVTSALAAAGKVGHIGRLGIKALIYFELTSTLALATGLFVAHVLQPGANFHIDASVLTGSPGVNASTSLTTAPRTFIETVTSVFMGSSILQVLLLACVCGMALAVLKERAASVIAGCDWIGQRLVKLVGMLMKLAPFAAFGAIAFTVGKYGVSSITPLITLLTTLYATTALFVLLALGAVARCAGFRILPFIRYLKEELLLVFGTSSSVTAMPRLIEKLEQAGCAGVVARIAVPAGYSFNLNGSNIYLTMALVFLAQALQIQLGLWDYITILALAMVTSKGASGVAGSAFIALAATIVAVPAIPDSSLFLIVGIERLLKCRPLANVIGNGVACMAIAAWDGKLDRRAVHAHGLT